MKGVNGGMSRVLISPSAPVALSLTPWSLMAKQAFLKLSMPVLNPQARKISTVTLLENVGEAPRMYEVLKHFVFALVSSRDPAHGVNPPACLRSYK